MGDSLFETSTAERDKRGFDLISDVVPFDARCYAKANAISNAIGYAKISPTSPLPTKPHSNQFWIKRELP